MPCFHQRMYPQLLLIQCCLIVIVTIMKVRLILKYLNLWHYFIHYCDNPTNCTA